jgi:hypothetical protein
MARRRTPDEHAPREPWQYALCAVFLAGGLSDLMQSVGWAAGSNDGPGAIALWHVVTFATSAASLVAIWRRQGWAPYAVAAWGVANVTLLLSIPLFVSMPAEAVRSVWVGAGLCGVLAAVCVWIVWRRVKRQ